MGACSAPVRLTSVKGTELSSVLKCSHSISALTKRGESSVNYKSRGFKRICRSASSSVCCPQLLITCLQRSGPCYFYCMALCMQTNPPWHAVRSCQAVRRAPAVKTDITRKGQHYGGLSCNLWMLLFLHCDD